MGNVSTTQQRDLKAEVAAIQGLRSTFFAMAVGTLTTKIVNRSFAAYDTNERAAIATGNGKRTRLSVYSVIRRYDAKNK